MCRRPEELKFLRDTLETLELKRCAHAQTLKVEEDALTKLEDAEHNYAWNGKKPKKESLLQVIPLRKSLIDKIDEKILEQKKLVDIAEKLWE